MGWSTSVGRPVDAGMQCWPGVRTMAADQTSRSHRSMITVFIARRGAQRTRASQAQPEASRELKLLASAMSIAN